MVDLHSHVLPGLDDGPATLDESISLARVAARDGTTTLVATPHINAEYGVRREAIAPAVTAVNAELVKRGVDLQVVAGAELDLVEASRLDVRDLQALTIADGPYLLVESPHLQATDILERVLFRLQALGFVPILAHPERSAGLMNDRRRLDGLVSLGVLVSVTAASLDGQFGRRVQAAALKLIDEGLVHNLASDAHDYRLRSPCLTRAREPLAGTRAGAGVFDWLTLEVPRAVVEGQALPPRPKTIENRARKRIRFRVRPSARSTRA